MNKRSWKKILLKMKTNSCLSRIILGHESSTNKKSNSSERITLGWLRRWSRTIMSDSNPRLLAKLPTSQALRLPIDGKPKPISEDRSNFHHDDSQSVNPQNGSSSPCTTLANLIKAPPSTPKHLPLKNDSTVGEQAYNDIT